MPKKYRELQTVRSQKNEWLPEEFPEGPYGSPYHEPIGHHGRPEQHITSAFAWENRSLHEGIPRQVEPKHPPHDDPSHEVEPL
ncbi:conserved hypothetical protein [[Clostridium] ultunense Esp]|uniref:hypothetical protein n=1 Tax=Thermicanus aegyptius TaxID=94009 RepID=UPI0002B701A3|nr:hypothetical protein [Thermicanus aegyptius]CCQ94443.1 conserved hypothetical protein [[Clostridium] ultunense Esp]